MRKFWIGILVLTFMLTGITTPSRAQTAAPTSGGNLVMRGDCDFATGIGEPKQSIKAKCGSLSVPENRAVQNGRRITLEVRIIPPLDPAATGLPIFHLEGGPGGSALLNFGQTWIASYRELRKTHPVVLMDQRGVGQSASLQCTEISGQALNDLQSTPSPEAEAATYQQRLAACLSRLSPNADPQYYTSDAAADDLDDLRAALGNDQILVFGNSYGTWLGQYYLKRHGQHVAGMVLDSVVGPWNQPDLEAYTNGQAALDKVFAWCKADAACDKVYPDLSGKLQQALDKLKAAPVRTSGVSGITTKSYPLEMTADRLRSTLFGMLYNVGNAGLIPQAITDAARGNYLYIAAVLISNAELANEALSLGLNLSVTCAESLPFLTETMFRERLKDNLLFGTAEEQGKALRAQIAACKAWRSAEYNAADVAPITSDRPVLILSGAGDPVTPPAFGAETHARLPNSTFITFPYQAHGVLINSKCAQVITAAFLDNPTAKPDPTCVANDLPPRFSGAVSIPLSRYDDPQATFRGVAPTGWKAETQAQYTFFTSPDGLQFLAQGVIKSTDVNQVRDDFLRAVAARYGAVQIQQQVTQSLVIITIVAVAHALDTPAQAYTGVLYLRPTGNTVSVIWQAAPSVWFQAISISTAPALIASILPR